jgi:hypothetical protein
LKSPKLVLEFEPIKGYKIDTAVVWFYLANAKDRWSGVGNLREMKEKCIQVANTYLKLDNTVKIIPGYQTLFNTIIASTTDDFHKVYLFHGVFGEVVYKYESRQLQSTDTAPLFFTNNEVIYYFTNLREYFNQSKQIQ